VHRDIKPGNVAYAEDGRVRVLDFGITQLAESTGSQALTATHMVMGTAEYLSPEQALGGRVDGRADLYALGCVLFALLAGQPPFTGTSPVATMMMHANDPVPDVRTLRPETPDWLADLVHALMAKSPDDRPAGAATVAAALATRESLGGAATTVLPAAGAATTQRVGAVAPLPVVPPVSSPEPGRRDNSPLTWVLALAAVAAIAVLVWLLLKGDAAKDPAASPSTTPTASASTVTTQAPPTTAASTPTPTPTETPTETPSPSASPSVDLAGDVSASLSAFSDEVGGLRSDGILTPATAKMLQDRARDIEKALGEDDRQKVTAETDKLVEEYDKAVQADEIPAEGSTRLDPVLADLTDAVDAYTAG